MLVQVDNINILSSAYSSFFYLFIQLTTILLLIVVNSLITFNVFMTQQTYFFLK